MFKSRAVSMHVCVYESVERLSLSS